MDFNEIELYKEITLITITILTFFNKHILDRFASIKRKEELSINLDILLKTGQAKMNVHDELKIEMETETRDAFWGSIKSWPDIVIGSSLILLSVNWLYNMLLVELKMFPLLLSLFLFFFGISMIFGKAINVRKKGIFLTINFYDRSNFSVRVVIFMTTLTAAFISHKFNFSIIITLLLFIISIMILNYIIKSIVFIKRDPVIIQQSSEFKADMSTACNLLKQGSITFKQAIQISGLNRTNFYKIARNPPYNLCNEDFTKHEENLIDEKTKILKQIKDSIPS